MDYNSLSLPEATTIVTLEVGERKFRTTKTTLCKESAILEALFTGRWGSENEDGSYFIDADPDLFEHILRYLRRGIYPMLFDKTNGWDVAVYNALLVEAEYFQINRLVEWIRGEKYKTGVTFERRIESVYETSGGLWCAEGEDVAGEDNLKNCYKGLMQHNTNTQIFPNFDEYGRTQSMLIVGKEIKVDPEVFRKEDAVQNISAKNTGQRTSHKPKRRRRMPEAAWNPQNRLFFFYGTLKIPAVLQRVLSLPQTPAALREACIIGYKIKMWGPYPALVKCDPSDNPEEYVIEGAVYEVETEHHLRMLEYYEGETYGVADVPVRYKDTLDATGKSKEEDQPATARTFVWAGEISELKDGVFKREQFDASWDPFADIEGAPPPAQ